MAAMDPDATLVRQARRGDRRAFELLVERHERRLYTLAARVLGSADGAADAVQEAFLRAWLALPRFRGEALFATWLYRICLNAARDQRARAQAGLAPEVDAEAPDPRDGIAAGELAGALQQALAELDGDFRVAVVLYDVLGCSYAEVAEATGAPEGTVKSRIFRGRAELARRLGTRGAEPESKGR